MATDPRTSADDDCSAEYAAYVKLREEDGSENDPLGLVPHLLEALGDVAGRTVLDAGCGESYLARILAARGAVASYMVLNETADRDGPEIAAAGGHGAWMRGLDADPRRWAHRLTLARLHVAAMIPVAGRDTRLEARPID